MTNKNPGVVPQGFVSSSRLSTDKKTHCLTPRQNQGVELRRVCDPKLAAHILGVSDRQARRLTARGMIGIRAGGRLVVDLDLVALYAAERRPR